jgi:uncharacterized protein (DUF488 family)
MNRRIFTIGHSNYPVEFFLELLQAHSIEVLVDARSRPYSRYVPHFGRERLQEFLRAQGLRYLYMGDVLGGRPAGAEFYNAEGHVRYDLVAESPAFVSGLDRLIEGAGKYRVAVMCAEENPAHCHRHLLIGRALASRGVDVFHIRREPAAVDPQAALF